jgi:hypothetical protein
MIRQGQTRMKAAATRAPSFMPARTGLLQRKCACGGSPGSTGGCSECRKEPLQRRAADQSEVSAAPPVVNDVLRAPGQSLDAATRAFMEPRFGHDFSQVRVHTDAKAAESARAVHALAYTVGRDVVFGAGRYAPGTPEGDKLIAHELTHVAQQSHDISGAGATLRLGTPGDAYERQADLFSTAAVSGSQAAAGLAVSAETGPFLRRQGGESVTQADTQTDAEPADGKRKGDCSAIEKNRRGFAIRIADYFYRTELGGEGAMKAAPECDGDPIDVCKATYTDGTTVTVFMVEIPNSVAASSGLIDNKSCEYTYDCPKGKGVVFTKKQCSGKQGGAEKEMAQE